MERPRMHQTMPEDRDGWHQIDAGAPLEILFHPNRQVRGREPDQIVRPSIVVAVAGKREQALRFDPFSMGAHYHIRPGLAPQIPLPVEDGQQPLDAVLAFFEKPLRFRGLLALAEKRCRTALGCRAEERRPADPRYQRHAHPIVRPSGAFEPLPDGRVLKTVRSRNALDR